MVILAGLLLHSMLVAAQPGSVIEFRVTNASVSYETHETNLGSSLKTVIGRNKDLSLRLNASPGGTQAGLVVAADGFKTDRPMRDWSVKTLYLKSGTYPEITFQVLKIDGEDISKVLRPTGKTVALKADPENMTVGILVPGTDGAPLLLRTEDDEVQILGKLRDDILRAIHTGKGDIPVTGRLTVTKGSKDFHAVVKFSQTGKNEFTLSTIIHAEFTDFGMTAPVMPWFIEVHNDLILRGHAVIEVLK